MANWNSLTASEFTKVIQDFLADHHYDDGDHQLSNLASRKVHYTYIWLYMYFLDILVY